MRNVRGFAAEQVSIPYRRTVVHDYHHRRGCGNDEPRRVGNPFSGSSLNRTREKGYVMTLEKEKLVRQLSLVAFLMSMNRPITARDVRESVEG